MGYNKLRRAGAVARDHVSHPTLLGRYMRFGLLSRRTPLEVGMPWVPFTVIDRLATFLKPHMRVFEYGSGGSTIFFAQRVAQVCSVEENERWYQSLQRRLQDEQLWNVELLYRPFDFAAPLGFEQSEYLSAISACGPYDLILIDGTDYRTHSCRPHCFRRAEAHIKPGGIIAVDDAWRYQSLRKQHHARRVETIEGVRPGARHQCNRPVRLLSAYPENSNRRTTVRRWTVVQRCA